MPEADFCVLKPADAFPAGVSGLVAVPNRAGIALGGNSMDGIVRCCPDDRLRRTVEHKEVFLKERRAYQRLWMEVGRFHGAIKNLPHQNPVYQTPDALHRSRTLAPAG